MSTRLLILAPAFLVAIFPVLNLGCSTTNSSTTNPDADPAPDARPASDTSAEPVNLQQALLPTQQTQPVHIRLHEERESIAEHLDPVQHVLTVGLTASLTADEPDDQGRIPARLVLDRIQIEYSVTGEQGQRLTYDSRQDRSGQGNALADLMQCVDKAEIGLLLNKHGRLIRLSGLDPRWRGAGILMAPPGLLTVQWTFRDASMAGLIAEALFPELPGEPVKPGDEWEHSVSANIPLVARLNARTQYRFAHMTDRQDGSAARIEGTANLEPAEPLLEGRPPAVRPNIRLGRQRSAITVNPATGALTQHSFRTLEARLVLTPPLGDNRAEMTLRQTRTLQAMRGAMPAGDQQP